MRLPHASPRGPREARSPSEGAGCILFTGGGLAFDPRGWPEGFSLSVGKAGVRGLAYSRHDALEANSIRVGTVTVAGIIQEGAPFAPDPGPEIVFEGA